MKSRTPSPNSPTDRSLWNPGQPALHWVPQPWRNPRSLAMLKRLGRPVSAGTASSEQIERRNPLRITTSRPCRGFWSNLAPSISATKDSVMSRNSYTRALSNDLEIRSSGDGRTVHGIVVPFDSPTQISDYDGDYQETFKRGSFARSIAERGDRIKFLSQHQRTTNPLGRAVLLREDAAGLYGEFRVSATQAGDEVLELIRDGALDSFSVGFQPIRETWNRNRTERTHYESKLTEVSVVSFPAYEQAHIAGVRAVRLPQLDSNQLAARLGLLKATYGL